MQMFWVFSRLALQGFGGVIAIAQRELVDRQRWLTAAEFLELLAVSQVLPGPNVVNLSLMLGDRHFGWRGVVASVGGMLLLPMLVVLAAAALYGHWSDLPQVSGALARHGRGGGRHDPRDRPQGHSAACTRTRSACGSACAMRR